MDAPESELSVINGGDAFRGENVHLSGRKHQDKYLPDEICKFKYLTENCAGPNGVLDGAFQGNCAATLTASLPLGPPLCLYTFLLLPTLSVPSLHFRVFCYNCITISWCTSLSFITPPCFLPHPLSLPGTPYSRVHFYFLFTSILKVTCPRLLLLFSCPCYSSMLLAMPLLMPTPSLPSVHTPTHFSPSCNYLYLPVFCYTLSLSTPASHTAARSLLHLPQ